jgi:methyl-accepting chemotaxis protein
MTTHSNQKVHSLGKRVLLASGVALAIVFTIITIWSVGDQREEREELVNTRAELLLEIMSESMSIPLWEVDLDVIESQMISLSKDPDFQYADVVDFSGESLGKRGRPGVKSEIILLEQDIFNPEDSNQKIGRLHLELSTAGLIAASNKVFRNTSIQNFILFVIIQIIVYLSLRMVLRPLVNMERAMRRLADGDNDVEVPSTHRKDEIGAMAGAVQVFKLNAIEKQEMESKRKESLVQVSEKLEEAVGNISLELTTEASNLARSSHQMQELLKSALTEADGVSSAGQNASLHSRDVARASDGMVQAIHEISQGITNAASVSERAVGEANDSHETISMLAKSVEKVQQFVGIVNEIADQTNLLALNATIEAASAGDAGKGFAVVASEVKELSKQTSKATEEIGRLVSNITETSGNAVKAIDSIRDIISEVSEISTQIAAAVEEQDSTTAQIAENTQAASENVTMVSERIEHAKGNISQATEAASLVDGAASSLENGMLKLNTVVAELVQEIREG